MRESNRFGKEETVTIIESRPRNARIPANVRAIRISPDAKDWKAKPRLDDIDALIARLPPHTVELIDIDYDSRLPRLPCLDSQSNIRYAHIGAHKLRDYSPLFSLTRLESLFLVSFPLAGLVSVPGSSADLPESYPRACYAFRFVRNSHVPAELHEAEDLRQGWHCQSHSRVLPARGFGVACDGARAPAVATARARTAAKHRCAARMQVIGVFGNHRYAPGRERFPGSRQDATLELGILDCWRHPSGRTVQSISARHVYEWFGVFSRHQAHAVRTILSRDGSGEVSLARVISAQDGRGAPFPQLAGCNEWQWHVCKGDGQAEL